MADNYVVKDGNGVERTITAKEISANVYSPRVLIGNESGTTLGTAAAPVRTDPTGSTAQPVTDNGGTLSVDDGGGALTVDGTVTIQDGGGAISVDDGSGSLTVDGTITAVGGAASGAAVSGNPVLVAGTDSTNARTLLTDSTGRLSVIGPVAHDGANVGYAPLLLGGTSSAAAPSDVSDDGDSVKLWALRNGALAVQLTASGALIPGDATAGLSVKDAQLTITGPVGGQVASADTSEHAFSTQALKAPVTIAIGKDVTGTVTIRNDNSDVLAVLEWDDTNGHHNPSCSVTAADMDQLTYQFSVNAGTELFRWNSAS